MSLSQMAALGFKALRDHSYTASQTLMAANAPFLIQRAISTASRTRAYCRAARSPR